MNELTLNVIGIDDRVLRTNLNRGDVGGVPVVVVFQHDQSDATLVKLTVNNLFFRTGSEGKRVTASIKSIIYSFNSILR